MQNYIKSDGFLVPDAFVEEKMLHLDDAYIKVYLYARYLANKNGGTASCDALYAVFGDTAFVREALKALARSGCLYINKEAILSFEPLGTLKKSYSDRRAVARTIAQDAQLQMLMQVAEKLWARTLTATDVQGLFSLYDWLGLPVEVIIKLLEYCAELGKKSMAYIEKVAIAWHREGISTLEAAEAKISDMLLKRTYIYKAKQIFGTGEHNFSTSQKEYLMKWQAMGVSEKLLAFAFDYTIDNTGKLAFAYMDKVLCAWMEAGARTPALAQNYIDAYKNENTAAKKTQQKPAERNHYAQTNNYDYEEIRRLARRNIRKKLGKE